MTAQDLLREIRESDKTFDDAYDEYVSMRSTHTGLGFLEISQQTDLAGFLKAICELDDRQLAAVACIFKAGAASVAARSLRNQAREIESRC